MRLLYRSNFAAKRKYAPQSTSSSLLIRVGYLRRHKSRRYYENHHLTWSLYAWSGHAAS